MLINNDTHQRDTSSERPIRLPLLTTKLSLLNLTRRNKQGCSDGSVLDILSIPVQKPSK